MDSLVGKALMIAAGVLLAMLIIAFMTFSFRQLSSWATAQDEVLLAEQREKFNKEYEAYDKDLMFGVDVISCLNKAKSNNDKIVGGGFIYGEPLDESYKVTVEVKLKSPLSESIRVYGMDSTFKNETEYLVTGKIQKDKKKLNEIFKVSGIYQDFSKDFGGIEFDKEIDKMSKTINMTSDTLILGLESETTEILARLLEISDQLQQVVKNNSDTSTLPDSWTKAVWETPLYEMKTRKFTCQKIGYNAETGRVNSIKFVELK